MFILDSAAVDKNCSALVMLLEAASALHAVETSQSGLLQEAQRAAGREVNRKGDFIIYFPGGYLWMPQCYAEGPAAPLGNLPGRPVQEHFSGPSP